MTLRQRQWAARGLWLLLAANLALTIGWWAWNSIHNTEGNLLNPQYGNLLLAFGRLAGLFAAFLLLLQFLLVGRIAWLEKVFGHDRLTHAHHFVGGLFLVCVVAHPLLLIAHYQSEGWWTQLRDFWENWDDVAGAIVAAGIFIVVGVTSWRIARRRLPYEWWMALHTSVYLAFALAFAHQFEVGGDLVDHAWFSGYWYGLAAFVGINYLWYRVLRPLVLFARHRFHVQRVEPAAQDIVSVYIGGRDLAHWRAQAGQFVLVRFWAPGFRWFAHPFSLSAAPDGSCIRLTIKALGDYTRRIAQLQPGTPVLLEGPLGIFTADVCRARAAVLIAGGIGITPLRAVAQEFCKRGVPWTLLHSVTTPGAAALREECENLARAHAGCAYHLIVTKDPTWPGERGHIDRDMLTRLVPDIRQRDVYLCGPVAMMRALRRAAASCGVPHNAIHFERFAL